MIEFEQVSKEVLMKYSEASNPWCANNVTQIDIHPRVTADQMTVISLTILQLH